MHKSARVPETLSKKRSLSPPTHHRQMTTPRHHAASSPPLAVLTLLLWLLLLLLDAPAAAQDSPSRDKDSGGGAGGRGGRPAQPPSFSAPMVVLLVALIAAFFFIGFFSVYMRRCGRGASAGPRIPAAALLVLSRHRQEDEQQRQQRGLDPAVVASFPTMRYADAKQLRVVGGKDAALECAVCLSEFEDDEELRLLPSCSHAFHPDCIGEWLVGHVTCPVCRCNLDPVEVTTGEAAGSCEATTGEAQQGQDHQVVIDVSHGGGAEEEEEEEEDKRRRREEEAMELERIGSQRRAVRSRSGRPAPVLPPVPRSHSTGHSLATRLDGDLERFTLRLPEHVRREMVVAAGEESLRRTGPPLRERDARSARLGRSDRWPSFITRTFSSRVPFWSASRRATDLEAAAAGTTTGGAARTTRRDKTGGGALDGSVTPSKGSVRFDCLGVAPVVTGTRVGAAAGDSETEEEDDDEEKAIALQRQA